jgi:hypothetical protein
MKIENIKDAKFAPFKKRKVENPRAILNGYVETSNSLGQGMSERVSSVHQPNTMTILPCIDLVAIGSLISNLHF